MRGEGGGDVFLTGATGFVGSHILDALLDSGHRVRALSRTRGAVPHREGVSEVVGDVTRAGALAREMHGCRWLVHTAAVYSFAPHQRSLMASTNVAGTVGILEAARLAGIERAVVTSSSATVGPAHGGRPATEADHADVDGRSAYHDSKIAAERAALAARMPVVLVLPTAPVGTRDHKPTPTGAALLTFLRGRVRASIRGGLNVVAVEEVAAAHVAALHTGVPRRRYLVGGENLTFDELWARLGAISGRRAPRRHMPRAVPLAAAWVDEARCRLTRAQPVVPLEGVRMAGHRMFIASRRAELELGVPRTSVDSALERAVRWYADNGYLAA
jgi:dihydroflavonol-4-reductase